MAVGHQASPMIGLVAASLPDGAEVVVADGQFTSTLFPFLAQERRGVEVRSVPFDRVADAVTTATSLVAVEAVRSDSGAVADLAQIRAAARDHDARVLADTTQATGWLDIDASRPRLRGLQRVQVAAVAARHGVHVGQPRGGRDAHPPRRRLVRRRRDLELHLRRAAAAGRHGAAVRHLARPG